MNIIQRCIFLSVVVASACEASTAKAQYTLATLATFNDFFTTGGNPYAGLIIDGAGDLYGTTYDGGVNGYGTVFKVANDANHTLSTVISFNSTTGANPFGGLITDATGNLYGTTQFGGPSGNGTVFKLANDPNHTLTTMASFNNANGANPAANLLIDAGGNLYGTTRFGGVSGQGTVFKVANDANHTLSTLVSFDYFTNGADPQADLIADAAGNLYGTTSVGGVHGVGTVFKMANDANHTLSILASFNGANGSVPHAGLIADAAGNLYGTTEQGGDLTLNGGAGYGTVFRVANDANHTLSTLAKFNGTNGYYPEAGLIADGAGNLFGTTEYGGASADGTVFEVANDASHSLSTLFSFNGTNGAGPTAGLITDTVGNLYGTTYTNGNITLRTDTVYFGGGTVFELSPVPEPASLVLGLSAVVPLPLVSWVRRRAGCV